jgi:hypothetical protein
MYNVYYHFIYQDANIVLDEPETSQNEGRSSNQMSTIFNGILPGIKVYI